MPGPQQVADSEWGGSEASSPLARRYGSSEWGGGGGSAAGVATPAAVESLQRQLEELRLQAEQERAAAAEREAHWRQQAQQAARQQQQQAQRQQQQDGSGGGSGRAPALAAQCDALTKERDALRTILDRWARGLLQAMRQMRRCPWG